MLERLADLIRVQDFKNGFEATAEMLSITGLTLLQFKDLMLSLGYKIKSFKRSVSSEMGIKDQKKLAMENDKISKDILENTIQNSNDLNESEEEYFLFIFNFKRSNKNNTQKRDILNNQKKKGDGKVKKTKSTKKIIYSNQEKKYRTDEVDPNSPFATLAALIKN